MAKTPATKRTTLELDAALWARAKKRAIDEDTDLRTLLLRGLAWVLDQPKG